MLDLKKLDVEFDKILDSYTKEDLWEWVEFDKKRMARLLTSSNLAGFGVQ